MSVLTRINNNQVTDAVVGNVYLGVNAAAKVQSYSITSTLLSNNLVYGSDLTVTGNLTINGNTTTVDTYNLVVEDPLILLAKGQTGSPTLDIGFIGKRGTDTNIAFVWDEANDQFVTAYTSSETTNTTITISSYADLHTGNLTVGGTTTLTGNVASITVTGNVVSGNLLTSGLVSATGNVTGGNVTTAGQVTATGNVTAGNVLTGGLISATGSITSANGITATANVTGGNITTGGLVTATGNVTGGNITTGGLVTAGGNVVGANFLTTGNVSASGNVTGGNVNTTSVNNSGGGLSIYASGDVSFIQTGNIDATSSYINNLLDPVQDQDAATKIYVDNMVSTGLAYHTAVYAATISNLATTTGGTITYNQPNGAGNGIGATITTTGSFNLVDTANIQTVGTRVLVKDEGNAVLNGVYTWANSTAIVRSTDADTYGPNSITDLSLNDYFFVQQGNVNKGSAWVVDGPTGTITFGTSNITFAQFSSSQTYTANTQAGISLTGTVFSALVDNDTTAFDGSGNIIVKAGANLTTPNIGAATGTSLSVTGNVTGGNVSVTGNVYAANFVGNISGNIDAAGSNTQVQFNDTGDILGASANFTFDKATNTMTVSGTIGGTTVSASGNVVGGNVTTSGLVTATGNVTGGNITTGGLITATGNVQAGNINTAGLISATGNVQGAIILGGNAVFGTGFTQQACSTVTINATDSVLMPVGNTLQRPSTTAIGMLRFNTAGDALEVYTSTGWQDVGVPAFTVITDQQFAGTGACTTFTLSADSTTAATIVSINGVVQIPTTAYAVTGNSLVFTEAPAVSDTIDVRSLTTTTTLTSLENISGNAHVTTLDTSAAVEILGNLLPAANVTYDLGSSSLRWKDGWFSGTSLHLGNVTIKNVPGGNSIGFYGPDGTTPATIAATSVDTTQIANGTTNMQVVSSGGDIAATVGGVANVAVISTTGVAITGDLSVTGNATLSGNILGDRVQNGNTSIDIQTQNGNANITVGGTSNVAVFATTGAYITGIVSASGNVTGANYLTGGLISATGNVISGNISATNHTGTTFSASGNITGGNVLTGIVSASGNVTGANYLTGGLISATGNITGGNVSVGTGTINLGNIVNTNSNGVGNIGSATTYFNTVFAKATSAQYADLAEMYEADGVIEPGTVVCFGGAKEVTQCNEEASKRVAGVVSTNPSYIMNAGLGGEHVTAVALTGRVPTKVTGSIRKGDMLVAAGSGRARAEADPAVGTVIGKALADFDGADGVIEVVVGRL